VWQVLNFHLTLQNDIFCKEEVMNKRILAVAMAVVIICAAAGAGTMAWFTSSATSTGNDFTTGTLILGGVGDDGDTPHVFKNVKFEAMEPGEPPEKVQTTILKNVGTLPFYLYRLTASELTGDTELDDVLNVKVTIGNDEIGNTVVYQDSLSKMVESNGGHFNRIYNVEPRDTVDMVIEVFMDESAGNTYQGLSMTCDFTVYAAQDPSQMNGVPEGAKEYIGRAENPVLDPFVYFDVYGKNTANDTIFTYEWNIVDLTPYVDYYDIHIKHHRGTPGVELDIRTRVLSNDILSVKVNGVDMTEELKGYISWDALLNQVTIKKALYEVVFDGETVQALDIQFAGSRANLGEVLFTSEYKGWYLD
jgi:predicted ribosomally synthesized peptide with SipW-like signal peptide